MSLLTTSIHDFEKLNHILETVWSAMSIDEILKRIIEETLYLCNANEGSIILIGRRKEDSVKTLVRDRKSEEDSILDHYLNNLLSGWVSQNKKLLLTNNLTEKFGDKNIKEKYRVITSTLCTPLTLDEKIIGVLNLISLDKEFRFSERELQLTNILASQCAHFIKNVKLVENLSNETIRLKKQIGEKFIFFGEVSHSPAMNSVFSLLDRVIPTEVRVLLEGESGTGKERIARAIHYNGPRKEKSFVAVDCGALPANLLESELFGYMKGAFTGANQDHIGLFEEANGGTLFLDEVGNMPLEVQSKLLRAVQEKEVRPLGSTKTRKIDVRIISAASENLELLVKNNKFRKDLFYRLKVVGIPLPPLRERKEDIVLLANHFLKEMNRRYKKKISGFHPDTIQQMESYSWPGNIRELEHAVERAVVLCESNQLSNKDFPFLGQSTLVDNEIFQPRPWQEALNLFKRQYLDKLLEHTGGNQSQAAKILKIQRTYLNKLLKEL